MIATKRRKLVGRSRPTPIAAVGLKAYLVSVEGNGLVGIYAVACKPDEDPVETVKTVQGLSGRSGLTFEVIPAEGLCVHLAGDVPAKGTRP